MLGTESLGKLVKSGGQKHNFLPPYASFCRHRNFIQSLKDEDGRETKDEGEMKEITRRYFQNLFSLGGVGDSNHILSGVKQCISNEVNLRLVSSTCGFKRNGSN